MKIAFSTFEWVLTMSVLVEKFNWNAKKVVSEAEKEWVIPIPWHIWNW